jgi:hypothetical protein
MAVFTAELFGSCGVPPGLATTTVAIKACPTNPVDCKERLFCLLCHVSEA